MPSSNNCSAFMFFHNDYIYLYNYIFWLLYTLAVLNVLERDC